MDIQTLTGIVIVGHAIYAGILFYYYKTTKNAKKAFDDKVSEYRLREARQQVVIKGLEYCLVCADQRIKLMDSKYQLLAYFEQTNEQEPQEEVKAEE